MREIVDRGRDGVAFGLYTIHPPYEYDNYKEENALPFGGGILRTVIDERGNERTLFLLTFADSHYYPEPTFGYSWLARWPVGQGLHMGAGYLLGMTVREDFNWLPCPMPLPVINVGTQTVGVYMTYIPLSEVFFFYGTITTDGKQNRKWPLQSDSPFAHRTELYGAWMHEKTDSATERGYTVSSDAGVLAGARHFFVPNWALDITYTRSKHDTAHLGVHQARFTHQSYSAALQYHINMSRSWRLHAGAGVGYGQWKQKDGPRKDTSVFPVVQLGTTWAASEHLRLLGGINLSFPRYEDMAPAGDVMFRPSPVHMYLGAGFAF